MQLFQNLFPPLKHLSKRPVQPQDRREFEWRPVNQQLRGCLYRVAISQEKHHESGAISCVLSMAKISEKIVRGRKVKEVIWSVTSGAPPKEFVTPSGSLASGEKSVLRAIEIAARKLDRPPKRSLLRITLKCTAKRLTGEQERYRGVSVSRFRHAANS